MTDMLLWPSKDPNETLDFQVDWSETLDVDTISSSTWVNMTPGITKVSTSSTTTRTVIWLSGGTSGHTYKFTNRITTTTGRIMDQTLRIEVWDR